MRGLEAPPKQDSTSRLVARMLVLLILLAAAGAAVYTATTNQRIDLTETVRTVGLDLADTTDVEGVRINVFEDAGGPLPVLILHDDDPTGALTLLGLSESLGSRYHGVRVDLPGFGYSDRIPSDGPRHTEAGMAEAMATLIEERFDGPVLVIGVGFGGEVGADLALTYPHLVNGLVMVDSDLWGRPGFPVSLERMPWVGRAATYTWETGGRFALDHWSPYCEEGGWCPTSEQAAERDFIMTIAGTTDSFHAFRETNDAALAPSNLEDIEPPVAYVWSTGGEVSESTVDRLAEGIVQFTLIESDSFQAHLEDFGTIVSALEAVDAR